VCDPACGAGAFLLAAADHLAARGVDRAGIVRRLVAIDIDATAVTEAVGALRAWCGGEAEPLAMVGDALVDPWPVVPDVVVGNPPFLSQLATDTVRSRERARAVHERFGDAAAGYVDDAALFLLAAARAVAPGGAVALLQPESVLATASASRVRAEVAPMLQRVELIGRGGFDAAVRVCAVVLRAGRDGPPVVRGAQWAPVVAAARGVPVVEVAGPPLGTIATVTAGFRDEYYGLVGVVREAEPGDAPVVTSGLIDPARCRWGERAARLGKATWAAPAAPVASLPSWAAALRVPKVVVATQTRVIEAAADADGAWVPSTPVLSVVPDDPGALWHVLAALLSPVTSAWAMATAAGAALSGDAVKLSAAQLRTAPLPAPGPHWDEAATGVRRASEAGHRDALLAAAQASCRAYGVDPAPLLTWWSPRLPRA
jgi:hypothetical protein